MTHRLPQHIVDKINDAIKSATLENASFDGVATNKHITITESWEGAKPKEWPSKTDLVRDLVRLHHGSWIIGPLKSILEWSESVDDGSMSEFDILGRLRAKWPNPVVLEQAHKEIVSLREKVSELEQFKRAITGAVDNLKEVMD